MEAPWKGEKVNFFFRMLAWIFIVCGIFAFGSVLFLWVYDGMNINHAISVNELPSTLFSTFASVYIFLLVAKVAVSGKAPSSWIPWQ